MKPAPFRYKRPTTVSETVQVMAEEVEDVKVLAGGQSLIPVLAMRLANPAVLVDINFVTDFPELAVDESGVTIGALTRHADLAAHDGAAAQIPLIRQTMEHVAHATIRNRGTTLGSIAHADPAGEMPVILMLLNGTVTAASVRGTRTISAEDFFEGPLASTLEPNEVAISCHFPTVQPVSPTGMVGTAFDELARRHGDYAMVGVAAVAEVDAQRQLQQLRFGYVSMGLVPVVVDVTSQVAGTSIEDLNWDEIWELANQVVEPDTDIHASEEYRRHLGKVYTKRVGLAAIENATAQQN